MFAQPARSLGIFRKWKRRKNSILIYEYSMEGVAANVPAIDPANVPAIDPANVPQMDEDIPPPPTLIRQNAQVMGNTVSINETSYDVRNVDGIEFIIINGELYNLKTDSNGRYIMMADGFTQPVSGGRRRSRRRRTKRSKSRRSRRV